MLTAFGLGLAAIALDACASRSPYYGIAITEQGTFEPSPLVVPQGTKVIWINKNTQPYTVTCDPAQVRDKAHIGLPENAAAWASPILYTGQTWAHTIDTPGSYIYTSFFGNSEAATGMITVTA
jgi:plastocyanin